jgi:hypothetical protein
MTDYKNVILKDKASGEYLLPYVDVSSDVTRTDSGTSHIWEYSNGYVEESNLIKLDKAYASYTSTAIQLQTYFDIGQPLFVEINSYESDGMQFNHKVYNQNNKTYLEYNFTSFNPYSPANKIQYIGYKVKGMKGK